MKLELPQLILLFLIAMDIGSALAKDGEKKTGEHSFIWSVIGGSLTIGLLYWGGFFK